MVRDVEEPVRLVTFAEIDGDEDARQPSVRARLDLELSGRRRVTVLDDRGWSWGVGVYSSEPIDPAELERRRREIDPWSGWTEQEIGETALEIVGEDSDDPSEGQTVDDSRTEYWSYLAGLLREQGHRARCVARAPARGRTRRARARAGRACGAATALSYPRSSQPFAAATAPTRSQSGSS